jgi:hypothetical protein
MEEMKPRNPLNDSDVDGNTIAWMADRDRGFEQCPICHDYIEDCNCDKNED